MPTTPDLSTATWHKSSYSNNAGGECIEVADGVPGAISVRDSKNPDGPALIFPAGSWGTFIATLKTDWKS
ncbi:MULTISPECIES: DUF397 domain-containing protein [Streptomyces]|uniref:DUF397 domain-containing protein n=1 Tax=Streptomyces mordarskii TaxID=1226758 RepID=A0ABP3NTS7_9ACTN